MGLFDRFKKKSSVVKITETPKPKKAPVKTKKEIATEKGEPYFEIVSIDINPNDINSGAFEFEWNDKMIADLVRHGYMMDPKDTESDIVDRWFTAVCRNVVLETYEQYAAMDPERDRVVKTRNIGDGRSEVS